MSFDFTKDEILRGLKIDYMEPSAVKTIVRMEQAFEVEPWSEHDIRLLAQSQHVIVKTVEFRSYILGYLLYSIYRDGIGIDRLTVVPQCRRFGIGRLFLTHLRAKLKQRGTNELKAAVRESNLDGQLFLKQAGFRCEEIRHNFYFSENNQDTAYVFHWYFDRPDSDYAPGLEPKNRMSQFLQGGA